MYVERERARARAARGRPLLLEDPFSDEKSYILNVFDLLLN